MWKIRICNIGLVLSWISLIVILICKILHLWSLKEEEQAGLYYVYFDLALFGCIGAFYISNWKQNPSPCKHLIEDKKQSDAFYEFDLWMMKFFVFVGYFTAGMLYAHKAGTLFNYNTETNIMKMMIFECPLFRRGFVLKENVILVKRILDMNSNLGHELTLEEVKVVCQLAEHQRRLSKPLGFWGVFNLVELHRRCGSSKALEYFHLCRWTHQLEAVIKNGANTNLSTELKELFDDMNTRCDSIDFDKKRNLPSIGSPYTTSGYSGT
ncbi:hypothetical protein M3Y94_01036600 [Aphelenchoides besseyi]|nr:hypothetical protein M3Y94_01036600 [Aphelenchoides besseyi]